MAGAGIEAASWGEATWGVAAWGIAALAALAVLRFARWFRTLARVGPSWPLRAEPSVLGFGAAFLAASVGAALAAAVAEQFWPVSSAASAPAQALATAPAEVNTASALARQTVQALGVIAAQLAVMAAIWFAPGMRTRASASVVARGGVHRHPCSLNEALVMSFAVAVLLWPVTQGVGGVVAWLQAWWGAEQPQLGHETLRSMAAAGTGSFWWWASAATAVVAAPVAEEWLYRGFLQQGLKATGMGVRWSVLLTAALFALVHWTALPEGSRVTGLLTLLILGIAWGGLYERTGRILAPAIAHALFNTANLALVAGW